ncbi:A24 family peptidase [Streptomyces sp. ZYX-F-203]
MSGLGAWGAAESWVIVGAVLWGVVAGVLLPRAAYRFAAPAGEPWRDRCPGGHAISGWLGRARCVSCAGGSVGDAGGVYGPGPALPAVTALVCVALAATVGVRPELAVWLALAPAGVLLAVVDLRVSRLPDPLTLPFAGATVVLLGLVAPAPGAAGSWTGALSGGLVLGAGHLALWLLNPAGMGFGDVKLALGVGAVLGWYGWPVLLLGTTAGFVLGAGYGGLLVLRRRAGRGTAIAFGPFLLAGALLGLLVGARSA